MRFEWDPDKERANVAKHGVDFATAKKAFKDPDKRIIEDAKHSTERERRFFCLGKVDHMVLTVRFTVRAGALGIFGAGYWREGRKRYDGR